MGKRNLNPADQARKNDRKKELKRNKKQRVEVRKAVLKAKDPDELIEQMLNIDKMAFDHSNPSPLPTRVLDEKREKIRGQIHAMMGLYKREKEDGNFNKLRAKLRDYDLMRQQLEESYVAVKFAKEADPQMIPLPGGYAPADAAMTPVVRMDGIPKHLLLPDVAARTATHSILKRAPPTQQQSAQRQPPGPPAGYPPELSSDEEEEDEDYYDESTSSSRHRARGVHFNENDDDEQNDEDDGYEKDTRSKYKQMAKDLVAQRRQEMGDDIMNAQRHVFPPPPPAHPIPAHLRTTQYDPYPIPPQAPVGIGPLIPGESRPQRVYVPPPTSAAVIECAPVMAKRQEPTPTTSSAPTATTFESKAQLRNFQAEVTKLVPTAVKVRRLDPSKRPPMKAMSGVVASGFKQPPRNTLQQQQKPTSGTTDDAYSQFMKEMSGFL